MKPSKKIPIVYFHSVAPFKNPNWSRSFLTIELRYFETMLRYFSKHDFHSVFLENYLKNRYTAPNKKYCLCFDDGYLDNYVYVFPLLKKYNVKATIFVNPEFVDFKNTELRPSIEDYWKGKIDYKDLKSWGFLNWNEMKIMEKSGLVDIQSHTMSHTKYFVSDKIIDFHNPQRDSLYAIINNYPEEAPFYIENEKFQKFLPYGYPIFEERSSIIARKVKINPEFINNTVNILKDTPIETKYNFHHCFNKIKPLYFSYKKKHQLILYKETEEEYKNRIEYELKESKNVLAKQLNKEVAYCCWPHGDNNETAHQIALSIGYKATTIGKFKKSNYRLKPDRINTRISLIPTLNNTKVTLIKFIIRFQAERNIFPFTIIFRFYAFLIKQLKQ